MLGKVFARFVEQSPISDKQALSETSPAGHGHTHHSFDYQIGEWRVVCNPHGYYPRHLNKDFNPREVVTV